MMISVIYTVYFISNVISFTVFKKNIGYTSHVE